jgi:putative flippase GtrA
MSTFKIEVTKFSIVGLINTALTFLIFILLLRVFSFNYIASLTLTWIVGILLSYCLNFSWVFKPEHRLQFNKRFAKYLFSYLLSFALNFVSLIYIIEHSNFDPLCVQAALAPLIAIFNFTTSKFWSLRPNIKK